MRKFKLFFYPLYILTILVVLYYGVDILNNMDSYKENMDFSFALKKLPVYMMIAFLFLVTLMAIELVTENVQLLNIRRKLKKAEEDVIKYKAMLYDRSESPPAVEEEQEEEDYSENNG